MFLLLQVSNAPPYPSLNAVNQQMQAVLGSISLNESKLAAVHNRETYKINQLASRVLRCEYQRTSIPRHLKLLIAPPSRH
jgi:hypothetical protein